MQLTLTRPFPLQRLSEAYAWHRGTMALSGRMPEAEWVEAFAQIVREGLTWGLYADGELVGIVAVEPVALPGQPQVDAFTHIALARRAWGRGVLDQLGPRVIAETFHMLPHLTRMSAWVLERNRAARRVAEQLGFRLEGVMEDAVVSPQRGTQGLALYGLTRRRYFNG